jgi:hypothetical protein
MGAAYVVGDVHGELDKLRRLLRDAGLVGNDDRWAGGDSSLWFIGDLVDRGPNGIEVIDLVIRLQEESQRAGGKVAMLIGNHDILLLAACHFGSRSTPAGQGTFREIWEENGGCASDLERLTSGHVAWLSGLPALAFVGDHLLVHGDSLLYFGYGNSRTGVNRAIAALLAGRDLVAWNRILVEFSEHGVFAQAAHGTDHARAFLDTFGGRQIVHGHTPIAKITGQPPEAVREPLFYAQDLCVDVDAGMYLGSAGFIYLLPAAP